MLSLFRASTLEDWTDIMYINIYGCNKYSSGVYYVKSKYRYAFRPTRGATLKLTLQFYYTDAYARTARICIVVPLS